MIEFLAQVAAFGLAAFFVWPLFRRLPVPEWLERARVRGRPGVPVTAWLGALLLMAVAWLAGERRGLAGLLLLAVWLATPLAALWISLQWRRRAERR